MWRPTAQFWTTLIETKVLWGTRNGVSEPDAGRCARARCISPESNRKSCNSYLFCTHALYVSGEWVWLGGYCVRVYFVVGSQTMAEDAVFQGCGSVYWIPCDCTNQMHSVICYIRLLYSLSSQYMFIYCVPLMHKPRKTTDNLSQLYTHV